MCYYHTSVSSILIENMTRVCWCISYKVLYCILPLWPYVISSNEHSQIENQTAYTHLKLNRIHQVFTGRVDVQIRFNFHAYAATSNDTHTPHVP